MDAATHAYLSCMLYSDPTTADSATAILNAHENAHPEDTCESHEMDYNNNAIGRALSREPGDCSAKAFAALNSGRLQVNSPFAPGVCRWKGNGL